MSLRQFRYKSFIGIRRAPAKLMIHMDNGKYDTEFRLQLEEKT